MDLWDEDPGDPDLETLDKGILKGGVPPRRGVAAAPDSTPGRDDSADGERLLRPAPRRHLGPIPTTAAGAELFERWAALSQLKATWRSTYGLFGERFRFFARRYLAMRDDERP